MRTVSIFVVVTMVIAVLWLVTSVLALFVIRRLLADRVRGAHVPPTYRSSKAV